MSAQTISIEPATPEDATAIADVLQAAKLPQEAIEEHIAGFLVAREGANLVGCVALERYGDTGILRSLAVTPAHRGRNLGVRLAESVIDRAKADRLMSVVLLTETAAKFFGEKLGFRVVERVEVDASARGSWQFTGAVCQSATCMKRDLQ